MGSLAQSSYFQNNISTTNKIPDYAKDFDKEWLFIRGINTTLENFVCEYLSDASELFVSSYSDRIKYYIRRFLKGQERGYLKDTSSFTFKKFDVKKLEFLFKRMHFDFEEDKDEDEYEIDDFYSVDLPGYRDFYELFCKFYDEINVGFSESESESHIDIDDLLSDFDNLIEFGIESDSDSDSESDVIDSDEINGLFSSEDSDSDSD